MRFGSEPYLQPWLRTLTLRMRRWYCAFTCHRSIAWALLIPEMTCSHGMRAVPATTPSTCRATASSTRLCTSMQAWGLLPEAFARLLTPLSSPCRRQAGAGTQRGARPDAEPAADGAGRLRGPHRRPAAGGDQPAGGPGPRADSARAPVPAGALDNIHKHDASVARLCNPKQLRSSDSRPDGRRSPKHDMRITEPALGACPVMVAPPCPSSPMGRLVGCFTWCSHAVKLWSERHRCE